MSYKLFSILLLVVFFSGCSTDSSNSLSGWFTFGSQGKQGSIDTPTTGDGLEISLDIDDTLLPKLRYTFEMRNTGDKPVELLRENVIFTTEERLGGQSVFTQDSLSSFYDKLFSRGNTIQIPPSGERISFSGVLDVREEYYRDYTNEDFTYTLKVVYDYETTFDNNIELDLENYIIKTDRPSQAAPVKMRKIEILPTNDDSIFQVLYTIEDSSSLLDETVVQIEDISIIFGSQRLNCRNFYVIDSEYVEAQDTLLSSSLDSLVLVCDVSTLDYDLDSITNTKTSGSFSYIYSIKEDGIIRFDQDSRSLGIS